MYFSKESNGYLIYEHNMTNKTLPFSGWIHNCIFCETNCTLTVKFTNKYHLINLLCCKDCKYSNKINLDKNKINKWINENIPKINENIPKI